MGSTLVCTLGTSAPVVSETLDALRISKGIHITQLIVIHTTFRDVFEKTTKSGRKVGLNALEEHLKAHEAYKNTPMVRVSLNRESVLTEEDNKDLLRILLDILTAEHRQENDLYVSIAGGYKTMSAMALFAAYLVGCKGIFHILVQGDEVALTDQYGFGIPTDRLALVEIPPIDLSPILHTVLLDIDPSNKYGGDFSEYIVAGEDIQKVFTLCNEELQRVYTLRKLKEEYDRRREQYQHMCFVVESILRVRSKEAGIMRPQQESRVKSFESILEKMPRKGKYSPFEQFDDLAGTRLICYFEEDVQKMKQVIETAGDFEILEPVDKPREEYGKYTGIHFIVTLAEGRAGLCEYKALKDVRCEIQLRTIFDHAWSQVEHRFRMKSKEFHAMDDTQRKKVDMIFTASDVMLDKAKKDFSALRDIYAAFRTADSSEN